MNRLYIEPEAELELEYAALRYDEAVPGLGEAFLHEMRSRVSRVLAAPTSFLTIGDRVDVRSAFAIRRFPHLVVFIVLGDAAAPMVHVLAFSPREIPSA
jgi:hypothetical protein